jgi:enolase
MFTITKIGARWILDSRSTPTIQCNIQITDSNSKNYNAKASVPSGASTGIHEAVELRDGISTKFGGKGVDIAIDNLLSKIGSKLLGKTFNNANEIDLFMLELEKVEYTKNGLNNPAPKSALGANTILAISMAAHRCFASGYGLELWQYLRQLYFSNLGREAIFPRLMCNIFNGGVHANNGIEIQEFMIVPSATTLEKSIQMSSEIYNQLKNSLKSQGQSVAVGDEGGFAPKFENTNKVLESIDKAVLDCGYSRINCDLALDCAASEFLDKELNTYKVDGIDYSQSSLTDFYSNLVDKFNLLSIEDPFAEDDLLGWELITNKLGKKIKLVGDDLFVTNTKRFQDIAIKESIANSVLIKLNQIGSVLETAEIINLAHSNNYSTISSHRSGETNDSFIADLAVAAGCEFIKLGAPARGERVEKYNRLLEIWDNSNN